MIKPLIHEWKTNEASKRFKHFTSQNPNVQWSISKLWAHSNTGTLREKRPRQTKHFNVRFSFKRLDFHFGFTRVSSITDRKQFDSEIRAHLRANFPKQPTSIFPLPFPTSSDMPLKMPVWLYDEPSGWRGEVTHNEYMAQQSHLRAVFHWTSLYYFRGPMVYPLPDLSFSHLGLWLRTFAKKRSLGKTPHFNTYYPFTFILKLSQELNLCMQRRLSPGSSMSSISDVIVPWWHQKALFSKSVCEKQIKE